MIQCILIRWAGFNFWWARRYNEQSRREQFALQSQVNDALKAKQSTLDALMMKLTDCHAHSTPVVHRMKDTLARARREERERERSCPQTHASLSVDGCLSPTPSA
jgi:hypothetical protein